MNGIMKMASLSMRKAPNKNTKKSKTPQYVKGGDIDYEMLANSFNEETGEIDYDMMQRSYLPNRNLPKKG